ncbi:hypothetical protein L21SP2_2133 [Salinispira pacifica]|uniref:Uncharacterized protein n=1 Tax=Salinispira pacifica TaxID=1307761 RepID=V5WIQ3_9SPIO|nr:hypothetical protein L21SP2_2133 [Salinispira pacifica]
MNQIISYLFRSHNICSPWAKGKFFQGGEISSPEITKDYHDYLCEKVHNKTV